MGPTHGQSREGIIAQHIRAISDQGGRVGKVGELCGHEWSHNLLKEQAIELHTRDKRLHGYHLLTLAWKRYLATTYLPC